MRIRARRGGVGTVLTLVALVVIALLLALGYSMRQRPLDVGTARVTRGASRAKDSAPPPDSNPSAPPAFVAELPAGYVRPQPADPGFAGCPASGDRGDGELNDLKNRVDSSLTYAAVTVTDVLALTWPSSVERRRHDEWTADARAAVRRDEGYPISIEGYFAGAKLEGPESPNCHGSSPEQRDWHLWLSDTPGPDRSRAVVVETTPAVRALHPEWTLAEVHALVRTAAHVRVSGWLMLDPEHPEQLGRTRGTLWEIHPVTRIEVETAAGWVPLAPATAPTTGRRHRGA